MALQHPRFTLLFCYQYRTWALTSHFHPYPHLAWGETGTVIFCGTFSSPHCCGEPAIHRWVALCCPDFPPPQYCGSDGSGLCKGKGKWKWKV